VLQKQRDCDLELEYKPLFSGITHLLFSCPSHQRRKQQLIFSGGNMFSKISGVAITWLPSLVAGGFSQ